MDLNIDKFSRIYLDTGLYIYFFENNPEFASTVEKILVTSTTKHISIIASTLLLTELLIAPIRAKNDPLIQLYKNLPTVIPTLEFANLDGGIAAEAANLRAVYNILTPDAIHLGTAKIKRSEVFITSDKNLKKIKVLPILIL